MSEALVIPRIGSIEAYIRTVNMYPLLSEEDEIRHAKKLKENDDLEAAKALILSHLRLVVSIAKNYFGYGLHQADLIQEGNIGLMKAVKSFDVEKGVRLATYASHWIRAEIHEFIIKNWRLVKLATTRAQRKLFFNLRKLKLEKKSNQDIASQLEVDVADVNEMEVRMLGGDYSLDTSVDDDGEEFSPAVMLPGPSSLEPHESFVENSKQTFLSTGIYSALEQLDERSQDVIKSRYMMEPSATLGELGQKYNVSAERIRQIEIKALKQLKECLKDKIEF